MDTVEPVNEAVDNAEAIEAWDGPLFDRFLEYRQIVVAGLRNFGDHALRLHPPQPGERVLDIGCGFGDTTQQLAVLVGPEGLALGVDAAPRLSTPLGRRPWTRASRTSASRSPTSS